MLSLAGVVGLAWLYLWRAAVSMHGGDHAAMSVDRSASEPATIALTFTMWVVMMAGMMLPSAAPTILLYAAMARKHAQQGTAFASAGIFVAGYLAVWTGFSLLAALLQAVLQQAELLTPMMSSAGKGLDAALLLAMAPALAFVGRFGPEPGVPVPTVGRSCPARSGTRAGQPARKGPSGCRPPCACSA